VHKNLFVFLLRRKRIYYEDDMSSSGRQYILSFTAVQGKNDMSFSERQYILSNVLGWRRIKGEKALKGRKARKREWRLKGRKD